MESQANSSPSDLSNFLDFLYEGLEGVAYVATKDPSDPLSWDQYFFAMPSEKSKLESTVILQSASKEVYLSPALYTKNQPVRENFKISNVVWTEFDGNAPSLEAYTNPPSLVVRSSSEQNQHVYWKLTNPISDVNKLEEVNKSITFALGADSSAWDATQVLRPPSTHNHKRDTSVSVYANSSTSYDLDIFNDLPKAPEQVDIDSWELGVLPNVENVILKYAFPPDITLLFTKAKHEVKDRSTSLMNLAYGCTQMGMSDAEVFVVLLNADERWEKFKGRKDQHKRLAHIITVARHKYPSPDDDIEPFTYMFGFADFLNTEIEIDWVIEGMLMENGTALIVGPSGIGKSQLSLRFMIHLALGKDYLHYKIPTARRIVFLSLEMGHGELKVIVDEMAKNLTPEEVLLLQENLIVIPHGEKWALNTPVGQEHLCRVLDELQPEGIFVDSIGSAMTGNISDDESAIGLMDFNDKIRKKYNVFTWYIHHMRKASNGGATPASQDDVYGNQYFVNRATSVYGMLYAKGGNIKIRNFKNRLYKKEEDFYIKRLPYLDFQTVNQEVDEVLNMTYKQPEEKKGPAKGEVHGKFEI